MLSPTPLSSGGSGLCNPPPQFSARMNFKAPHPPTPLQGPRQRLSPLSAAPEGDAGGFGEDLAGFGIFSRQTLSLKRI